jgi:hypothetical protein
MARLTTFSRLLITIAIVAGIFLGVKYVLKQTGMSPEGQAAQQTEAPAPDAGQEARTENGATLTFSAPAFNYTSAPPVNGKLKGIVELGATGFNSFIINVDAKKNWKLEKSEFGVSLVKEGLATDEDVKTGLRRYIADMVAFGVGARDIHFMVSSLHGKLGRQKRTYHAQNRSRPQGNGLCSECGNSRTGRTVRPEGGPARFFLQVRLYGGYRLG